MADGGDAARVPGEGDDRPARGAQAPARARAPRPRADRDRRHGLPLPGGRRSPEELWRLVAGGADAISEFPDRPRLGPRAPLRPRPRPPRHELRARGRLPHGAAEFDAAFFGISPREALGMDPQQRLLLEVCLGGARAAPASTRRRCAAARPACSSGRCIGDYAQRVAERPAGIEGYLVTGSAAQRRLRPGRLHASAWRARRSRSTPPARRRWSRCTWRCQALRARRVRAGAGRRRHGDGHAGSVRRVQPAARRWRRTAGARRSPTAADGTGWAEGVGVLLLERLSDARAQRATRCWRWSAARAVNQDGASNGLTAPNGPSQQRVIRRRWPTPASSPPTSTRSRRTAPAPRSATRSRRALLATYGQDRRAAAVARLGQVQHRPHPGRGRRGRRDQDGAGAAARRRCRGPCTSTSRPARRLGRRRRSSC